MRIAVLAAMLLASFAILAEEDLDQEQLTWAINALGRCSGVYSAAADLYETAANHANAENARGLARGAKFAAAYLLAREAVAEGREPKPYGFFVDNYVEAIGEVGKIQVLAMIENGDNAGFTGELEKCQILAELQVSLVQEMRDEMVDR